MLTITSPSDDETLLTQDISGGDNKPKELVLSPSEAQPPAKGRATTKTTGRGIARGTARSTARLKKQRYIVSYY